MITVRNSDAEANETEGDTVSNEDDGKNTAVRIQR